MLSRTAESSTRRSAGHEACQMNPRMAIDCMACARILTAAWSTPVCDAEQDYAVLCMSFVVAFAMGYSRRQLLANAAITALRERDYPIWGVDFFLRPR
jgi:hypothetical protein